MNFTVRDEDHINMLAVCYWVFGGLGIFTSCGMTLYLVFAKAMRSQFQGGGAAEIMPELEIIGTLSAVVLAFGSIMVVLGFISATMKIIAGFLLKKRKGYMFCLATAGLSICSMPMGTILAVFTFAVLMRQQVLRAFRTGEVAVQPVYPAYQGPVLAAPPQAATAPLPDPRVQAQAPPAPPPGP